MTIASNLTDIETKVGSIETSLTNIKTSLTNKKVEVPETTKLGGVPALIDKIQTKGGDLVITCPDFEGEQLTATKGEKSFKGTVQDGECRITVDEGGTWTVKDSSGDYTVEVETDLDFECELSKFKTYTIRINKNEADPTNRVEYRDDAVGLEPITVEGGVVNYNGWDKRFVLQKCYPVILNPDGTEFGKLNPNDYSKMADGSESDITGLPNERNAMVCIEKMYTKFWSDSNYEYMSITDKEQDGYTALGFINSAGQEVDKIYTGIYLNTLINKKLRSYSNATIAFGGDTIFTTSAMDTFQFKPYVTDNGANYELTSWDLYQVTDLIFNLVFKTEDCTKLGQGRKGAGEKSNYINSKDDYSSGSWGTKPNYKSGILDKSGSIGVDTSSGCVKFMHIEDYFSNRSQPMAEMLLGIYFYNSQKNKGTIRIKRKRPYTFPTYTFGFNPEGGEINDSKNYVDGVQSETGNIKESILSNELGRIPSKGGATSTTYECDSVFYDPNQGTFSDIEGPGARAGGIRGLECVNFCNGGPTGDFGARTSFCSRLTYIPAT